MFAAAPMSAEEISTVNRSKRQGVMLLKARKLDTVAIVKI